MSVCTVDGGGAGSCLRMTNVLDTARVEGFTFANGHARGLRIEHRRHAATVHERKQVARPDGQVWRHVYRVAKRVGV